MASPKASPRACLIDSSIYIFRAWFSLPDNWHSPDGWPLNAVYGYTSFLLEFLQRHKPAHCAAAFDESLGSCFRNELLPQYKSSRELPDEALAFQLNACRRLTELFGIPCYGGQRFEADDYLATLARLYRQRGVPVAILTRDKDLGQILTQEDDRWWDYAADTMLDSVAFTQRFGVRPDQFGDYLALMGDPVDDIPGVPGVGAKTAAALLQAYGDLAGLKHHLDTGAELPVRGAARISARLQEHWAGVLLARKLTALEDSIPGLDQLASFELRPEALEAVQACLEDLNLAGPLTRRCRTLQDSLARAADS